MIPPNCLKVRTRPLRDAVEGKNRKKCVTDPFPAVNHSVHARDHMKKYYIADLVPEDVKRRYTLDTYVGEGPEQNYG